MEDYEVRNAIEKELGSLYGGMSTEQLRHLYLVTLQMAKKWGIV